MRIKFPEIKIMSREAIEDLAKKPFDKKTAVISITDTDYYFAELKYNPVELLQIAFDDVDNDIFEDELGRAPTEEERIEIEQKYNMLSDEHASEIANFCLRAIGKVDVIICQCEHGQSRSAAVAAAIAEFTTHDGIKVFADDLYYPNKVVFRKVYSALINEAKKQNNAIKHSFTKIYEYYDADVADIIEKAIYEIGSWSCIDNDTEVWHEAYKELSDEDSFDDVFFYILKSGKTIQLIDVDDEEEIWELTFEKILHGMQVAVESGDWDGDIDSIDGSICNMIFQYSLFDEIVYPIE